MGTRVQSPAPGCGSLTWKPEEKEQIAPWCGFGGGQGPLAEPHGQKASEEGDDAASPRCIVILLSDTPFPEEHCSP